MLTITRARFEDAAAILDLQKLAYQSEAKIYDDSSLPALTQSLENLRAEFAEAVVLKGTLAERLVGSVRAKATDGICEIGRLIVHPDFQRQGIGSELLRQIEACFPDAYEYRLFTGDKSEGNIRLYQRHGYVITHTKALSPTVALAFMEKVV